MINRRRMLAALAIIALPVVAHGQPMPPPGGPPPGGPPPGGPRPGGPGRPEGIATGFFVKPTVFADVRNDMTIARE